MNEELQKALAEFVKATLEGLKEGKDFALAQAPELIQQLINWKFYSTIVEAIILLILVLASTKYIPFFLRKERASDDGIGWMLLVVISIIGNVFFACVILFFSIPTILQIWIAPKVWLLEWALSQVK